MKAEPQLIINLKNQILIGKYKKLFKILRKIFTTLKYYRIKNYIILSRYQMKQRKIENFKLSLLMNLITLANKFIYCTDDLLKIKL